MINNEKQCVKTLTKKASLSNLSDHLIGLIWLCWVMSRRLRPMILIRNILLGLKYVIMTYKVLHHIFMEMLHFEVRSRTHSFSLNIANLICDRAEESVFYFHERRDKYFSIVGVQNSKQVKSNWTAKGHICRWCHPRHQCKKCEELFEGFWQPFAYLIDIHFSVEWRKKKHNQQTNGKGNTWSSNFEARGAIE